MDAIQHLGAERIGHGLQIIHSKKVMEFVKQEGVVLEICPTSNWLTNAVTDLKLHPIRRLYEFGIKTTINTDDPGIFHIDLNHEYNILHELHGFTKTDFMECLAVSAKASFVN
jgi:adenosine deaminase